YEIELVNREKLIIKDTFFNNHPNDLEYLKLENIPKRIEELDIFAACFFMLTRWEEYVNKNRDSHDRFPATESLAFKQGFLDRPVVNEYVEELKTMLLDLDSSLDFKKREFQLVLTHDVDQILKYPDILSGVREIVGDIIKRKSLILALNNLFKKIKTHLNLQNDPFDTFDYLMDISESVSTKSYFFFMGKGLTQFDNMYASHDDFVKRLIRKIKTRGHHIGIHPTYNAYNKNEQFYREKLELEENLKCNITFGREHFLRFEIPTTWQIWEDNNMVWDSTVGYADKEGFRCGICYEYSVFNILTRKKLNLKEKPLIVMEGSFATYQANINPGIMQDKILSLMTQVKKYNGDFVYLWHNSSFNTTKWKEYQHIYENVLN
ncbi:MAG: polysaccharide deacetylase family protein, partial [Campylobacterota bacterium]|nr:polysaccharide deacetylase family protein [Campylobacterota bacterium]